MTGRDKRTFGVFVVTQLSYFGFEIKPIPAIKTTAQAIANIVPTKIIFFLFKGFSGGP